MQYRTLGRTGLKVSELGFGGWEIGWTPPEKGDEVGELLNRAPKTAARICGTVPRRFYRPNVWATFPASKLL